MIYGYARVSTKGQATNGNSLEEQEKALREQGCAEIVVGSTQAQRRTDRSFPNCWRSYNLGTL